MVVYYLVVLSRYPETALAKEHERSLVPSIAIAAVATNAGGIYAFGMLFLSFFCGDYNTGASANACMVNFLKPVAVVVLLIVGTDIAALMSKWRIALGLAAVAAIVALVPFMGIR